MSATALTLADPIEEARRIVAAADAAGVVVRVIGGVAVGLRTSPDAGAPGRTYGDIDLVAPRRGGPSAASLLAELGYAPRDHFNALRGDRRLLFDDPGRGRKLDVFVDLFEMCHRFRIGGRLDADPLTVPLAELLLTKLQVVELNRKDVTDIQSLLLSHDVVADDSGINARWLAQVCAAEWGLFHTVERTLTRGQLNAGLSASQERLVADRTDALLEALRAAPKSLSWRARARVGERVRWYELPEEVG